MDEELRAIVDGIYYGLTGHNETDVQYLMDQAEKYRDHKFGKEIAEECGRMIAERVSPEQMEEIRKIMDHETKAYEEILTSASDLCREGKLTEALEMLEPHIEALRTNPETDVYSFSELFEEVLYNEMFNEDNTVPAKRAVIPYSDFYHLYGSVLFELDRMDEAEEALEKATEYNPASAGDLLEYAEVFKKKGDMETYEKLTRKAFTIAFRPRTLARCYRNMGYSFIEKSLFREAVACYMLSLRYEKDSETAQHELYYIEKVNGKKIEGLTYEEVEGMSRKYSFPMAADNTVVMIAYNAGRYFSDREQYPEAVYFLEIAYGITGSDEIAQLLESIAPKLKNSDGTETSGEKN